MNIYGNTITNLISELSKLPGIGAKSAQRMAFYIINSDKTIIDNLLNSIVEAKNKVKFCIKCFNISDSEICNICSNLKRNNKIIMVVEEPTDMAAYEKTMEYNGLYHILHGVISPMNGISPSNLKIKELLSRINDSIEEVIIATNSNIEGEATAMYISKLLKPLNIKVTRIANGVPVGSNLEFVDEVTLSRALKGRILL